MKMLTLKQAAAATGLSYYSLRRMCLEGRISYIRSGCKYYINEASLHAYLAGNNGIKGAEEA